MTGPDRKNDFVYKDRDKGGKELFSMLIYRPIGRALVLSFFKNLNISPNSISFLSLVCAVSGSVFFAYSAYPGIIIGVVFLHLSYLFDVVDGQYARYKGLSTKYGQWLDPFLDTIKAAFIFISLSYGAYRTGGDHLSLVFGAIALANSLLTFYVMNTRDKIIKGPTFEVRLSDGVYIGYEISLYYAISAIVLFNKVHLGLMFLASAGALSWIKAFVTLRRYYFAHKEHVENK